MKKFLITVLISLIVLAFGLYFAANYFLAGISRTAINYLSVEAKQRGVDIAEADFKSVSFHVPNGVSWKKLVLRGEIMLQDLPLSHRPFEFRLNELTVGVDNLRDRRFFIKAKGLDALLKERDRHHISPPASAAGNQTPGDHLTGNFLETKFQFDFSSPSQALPMASALAQDLLGLLLKGRCSTFIEFSGAMNFTMNDKPVVANFRADRRDNESVLIMDPSQLEKISEQLNERLNHVEINLLSENALQAPELLRIALYAQEAAEKEHGKNPALSEDAYRHILWSYLLTKEYGPGFAIQITDAHEQGDSEESSAERGMDVSNNALGREYAQKGYPELQIKELVLQDPRVIRST